ncbi:MAG TPA: hypothetical protein VMW91_00320 [Desulfosporosinus sp.]|nr:hypothetical protein [Desulfosporosinus sp.]
MAPRHQSIHGQVNEFLHALSTALIDAIPLSVLAQLRNFLWLGSTGVWNDLESRGAVCVC